MLSGFSFLPVACSSEYAVITTEPLFFGSTFPEAGTTPIVSESSEKYLTTSVVSLGPSSAVKAGAKSEPYDDWYSVAKYILL